MIERIDIFVDSIFKMVFDDVNSEEIVKFMDYICSQDEGRDLSNIGGWQREYNINENKHIDNLIGRINEAANQICRDAYESDVNVKVDNLWMNINFQHCYNMHHSHPGPTCVLSGCYYPRNVEQEQGEIMFIRKGDYSWALQNGSLGDDLCNPLITTDHFEPITEKNTCLFFPNHMTHGVLINQIEKPRYSIAFNIVRFE